MCKQCTVSSNATALAYIALVDGSTDDTSMAVVVGICCRAQQANRVGMVRVNSTRCQIVSFEYP